jgi:hypothetical protein
MSADDKSSPMNSHLILVFRENIGREQNIDSSVNPIVSRVDFHLRCII